MVTLVLGDITKADFSVGLLNPAYMFPFTLRGPALMSTPLFPIIAYSKISVTAADAMDSGLGTSTLISVIISDTCYLLLTYLTLICSNTSLSPLSLITPLVLLLPEFTAVTRA